MTRDELQACIGTVTFTVHDQSARLDTMNRCLFNVGDVLSGGFEDEMSGIMSRRP